MASPKKFLNPLLQHDKQLINELSCTDIQIFQVYVDFEIMLKTKLHTEINIQYFFFKESNYENKKIR
jgi:hypothetical protein